MRSYKMSKDLKKLIDHAESMCDKSKHEHVIIQCIYGPDASMVEEHTTSCCQVYITSGEHRK